MSAEELRALAVWLEELASIDSAAHFPDSAAKHSAAARLAAAWAKLEEMANLQPGWDWKCQLREGEIRLDYGYWKNTGSHPTALEAIEGAGK